MPERISKAVRSHNMSRIRSKNTKPEISIRRLLHGAGFRFRLHRKDLPGHPDIVLPKWNAVIDVRGCYWHAHKCHLFQWPAQNSEFWSPKLALNVERDLRNAEKLAALNWRHLVVWECALRGKLKLKQSELAERVVKWLTGNESEGEIVGN